MSDEHETAPVTRAQAEEYARYWANLATSVTGQEQVDAQGSADYWAGFAAQLAPANLEQPEAPSSERVPTDDSSPADVENTLTSAQAREYEIGWATRAQHLSGDEQAQAYAAATYWQEQANALGYAESQQGLHTASYAQPFSTAQPRAPRRTLKELMTKGVIASLAAVSLLVVATIVAGILLVNQRVEERAIAQGPEAEKVAAAYLEAAIARDLKALETMQRSNFELAYLDGEDEKLDVSHIVGSPLAAESVDLEIDYEIVQTDYLTNGAKLPNTDFAERAEVVVKLTYQFTAEGKPAEVWSLQTVKLERDFYFGGENTPADFVSPSGPQPSFRGPWGVQTIDGLIPYLDDLTDLTGSDYQASIPEKGRYNCTSSHGIMWDIAEYALQYGGIPVTCLAGGADFKNFSNEDLDHLEASLTPLRNAPLTDAIGLDSPFSEQSDVMPPSPFVETIVQAGDRRFIFVLALVDPALAEDEDDAYNEYRLISIVGLDK